MKKITLLLFCMLMPSVVFGIEILATCGESKGEEYSFIDGWQKSSVSSTITLILDGEDFDILNSSSINKHYSYKEDGLKVLPLYVGEGFIRVGAFHESVTEIYNFSIEDKKVSWSVSRSGATFPKTSVYVADCEYQNN